MVRQTAAAVLIFAGAAVLGALLNQGDASPDTESDQVPATSALAVPTTEPRAIFVDPDETIIGPAAVVAEAPYLDRTQLVVEFSVANLAPTADAMAVTQQLGFGNTLTIAAEELNTVYLEDWVVVAGDMRIEGRAANPDARAARFEVGEQFDLASIDSVELAGYSVLSPIRAEVTLDIGAEAIRVAPGITARLLAVTEQARTIVQVELISERGFNVDQLRVIGSGPGWVSAVREAEGRPRWNLTYDSEEVPSPIRMKVEGSVWIHVDQTMEVTMADPE